MTNMSLVAQFADDDPQAPWMTDRQLDGMSPLSRRRSWQAKEQRKPVPPIKTTQMPDPAYYDDIPPPAGPDDYGVATPLAAPPAPAPTMTAVPWEWRDPTSLPTRQFLYGRHLIRGFVSGTVAPGGLGKSSLTICEALAMATGRSLIGKRVAQSPLRCWLWNLEDPQDELDRRVAAACLHFGLTESDLGGRLFVNSGRDQGCVIAIVHKSGAAILEPVIDAIVAEIIARQVDVVTIDPFVSCHQVPENDNGAQDAVVKAWGRVAGRGNCAVELVHHSRKLGEGEVTAESARGAVAFTAGCRDVRVLNRMTKEEGARLGIDNPRLFFRAYSDKANLSPPSEKSDWYQLRSIDLGNGQGGESDHVQAVEQWEWPDALDGVTTTDLQAVQKRVATSEWRQDARSPDWIGLAVAEVLNLDAQSAPVQTRIKSLLKTWIGTGALKPVKKPDEHRHDRMFIEVGTWV